MLKSKTSNSRFRPSEKLFPMSLKAVSLLLIIAYFLVPTLCYAHPCELYISSSLEIIDLSVNQQTSDYPDALDVDNCETTCCCAGYILLSAFPELSPADLTAKQLRFEPRLALPRLIDRIFIPPRNLS